MHTDPYTGIHTQQFHSYYYFKFGLYNYLKPSFVLCGSELLIRNATIPPLCPVVHELGGWPDQQIHVQSVLEISRAEFRAPFVLPVLPSQKNRHKRAAVFCPWIHLPGLVHCWCHELSRSSFTVSNKAQSWSWRVFLRS